MWTCFFDIHSDSVTSFQKLQTWYGTTLSWDQIVSLNHSNQVFMVLRGSKYGLKNKIWVKNNTISHLFFYVFLDYTGEYCREFRNLFKILCLLLVVKCVYQKASNILICTRKPATVVIYIKARAPLVEIIQLCFCDPTDQNITDKSHWQVQKKSKYVLLWATEDNVHLHKSLLKMYCSQLFQRIS